MSNSLRPIYWSELQDMKRVKRARRVKVLIVVVGMLVNAALVWAALTLTG